jgi:hypothetical protein
MSYLLSGYPLGPKSTQKRARCWRESMVVVAGGRSINPNQYLSACDLKFEKATKSEVSN